MSKRFGHKSRFAVEVGEFYGGTDALRRVDVWSAGIWLTCFDNTVYVPHFAGCLQRAVRSLLVDPTYGSLGRPYPESVAENYRRLRSEEDDTFWFMDWGPTADNVDMMLFREGGIAYLPFAFRPDHPSELGEVFVAELPERELAAVLHDAAWCIMWAWADRSSWPNRAEPGATPDPADM